MQKMGLNEIRSKFLTFFENKEHLVHASFPLVPLNDKSLLLINSGMAPLKNYFSGAEIPPSKRMTTCQKCIRTGDIERVGLTARHLTFFEMLGNFSFGDYFKTESIKWGWELCTEVLKLPADKLWVTVYLEDDEAFEIWNKVVGVPADKIVRLGKADNFWEIGTGPCGPCSEIYYDRGEKFGCGNADCKPGCDCDRYLEFWNHVFTQFDRDEEGVYHKLAKPNIDTGMGLERIACLMQDVDSVYEVDTIKHILDTIVKMSGADYGKGLKCDMSVRVITDHIRSVTFMVGDGIMPNNEGRGYVLRRLLRRAARHGKLLGIQGHFLSDLVDEVVLLSGEAFPELIDRKDYIKKIIAIEEDRFQQTLDQGLSILMDEIKEMETAGMTVLAGDKAFRLYDTYGFPLDLTKEILEEKAFTVDQQAFEIEMESQRERARSAQQEMGDVGWQDDVLSQLSHLQATEFLGYDVLEADSVVLAIVDTQGIHELAVAGQEVRLILDRTPFYAESGGQVGDHGTISTADFEFKVSDCKRGIGALSIHIGQVIKGSIVPGTKANASVDKAYRMDVARNHTATHLLHKALKEVLGTHVEQAGSAVDHQRLRFDFSHFQPMTDAEISDVEKRVNERIFESLSVQKRVMSIGDARAIGATALFGEKYGETVRVISVGDYSTELCGGTHLDNASQIGLFKIISETGVAAGVRRIEAVTGRKGYSYLNETESRLNQLADALRTTPQDLQGRVEALQIELKQLQKENEGLKQKAASGSLEEIITAAKVIKGVTVVTHKAQGLDMNTLRNLGDQLKDRLPCSLIVLANVEDDKVTFIAMATDLAIEAGAHAGNVIREVAKVAGGSGGGKANTAQAGGKEPSQTDAALAKAYEF